MWSKGDGGLIKLYPEHSYRDSSPNAAECLLLSCIVFLAGLPVAVFDLPLALRIMRTALLMAIAVMLTNVGHDLYRHLVLHPERNAYMQTTVKGARWLCAMVEGSLIRVFSEWGRVVGLLERGEHGLLMKRFDWFCGIWGDGPRNEEMENNRVRMALSMVIFGLLVQL